MWVFDGKLTKEEVKIEPKVPGFNIPPIYEAFDNKIKHNVWHDRSEFQNFIEAIQSLSDESNPENEWSWARNSKCKYVDIRIDMRAGGFVLLNKDGERISLSCLKWQYKTPDDKSL